MSYEEYAGLGETGYVDQQPTAPEDEFFHSVYIAGKTRKNHADVEEIAGKLQIRGVEYNLETVNIIVTHIKKILVKTVKAGGQDRVGCFSFKKTPKPPWFGFENKQCGSNSAERASSDFCKPCREQIVVAGVYCDDTGNPVLKEEKPIFVFLRGKGTKYANVSAYLGEMFRMDLDPIFEPVTEASKSFEKAAVNNKRFITKIQKGIADSAHGPKDVFTFEAAGKLPNEAVMNVLRIAKQTQDKFNEKIDWSKTAPPTSTTGYGQASVPNENKIPEPGEAQQQTQPDNSKTDKSKETVQPTFNFEEIEF